MRKGFFGLVLSAAFSVLAQPVCAALELRLPASHSAEMALATDTENGSGESTPCCAEADFSVLAPSASSAAAKSVSPGAQVIAVPAHAATRSAPLASFAQPAPPGAPPPLRLSYYARSARIQR